jgi:hypothetical protein
VVDDDEFVDAVIAAPVGATLLAMLEGRAGRDTAPSHVPRDSDDEAVAAAAAALTEMSWGALLSVAVDAAAFHVGPWVSEAPANLAAAYHHADERRQIAEAIAERFGAALHAPLDPAEQQWWHSGSPEVRFFTRPRFRDFTDVYGAGQFTWAGVWTVSNPPPHVHRDLIGAWELEPDPVSRWQLPIGLDARVFHIHRPADWVRLVTAYPATGWPHPEWELPGINQRPRELAELLAIDGQHGARTAMRRHLVPDWAAVAADYDGVHLSWAGFLTSEGYVSELGDDDVALLRYWFSERTHWLRDVFGEPVPLDAPYSDLEDVVLGVDVRRDATRRDHDLTVLRAQRGQRTSAT